MLQVLPGPGEERAVARTGDPPLAGFPHHLPAGGVAGGHEFLYGPVHEADPDGLADALSPLHCIHNHSSILAYRAICFFRPFGFRHIDANKPDAVFLLIPFTGLRQDGKGGSWGEEIKRANGN